MRSKYRLRILSPALLLMFLASGCGKDFSSIEKFGKLAERVKETSAGVSADIYNSCLRSVNFIYLDSKTNPIKLREEQEEKCDRESQPAAESATAANAILIDYMESLGRLASNSVASPSQSLSDLSKSVKQLKIPLGNGQAFQFKPTEVDAGTKIITFLAKALTNRFRQENIKQAVLCTNNDIQTYTKGLETMSKDGYGGVLAVEEAQIRGYYTSLTTELQLRKSNPLDYDDVRNKISSDMQVIQQKKANARNYVKILQITAETHQALYDVFLGNDKSPIVSTELSNICKSFFAGSKDEESTKSKILLKTSEAREANKLLLQYQDSLEYLIRK